MKRIISILIALVLVFGTVPMAAAAPQGITDITIISATPNEYRAELQINFIASSASETVYGTISAEDLHCEINGKNAPLKTASASGNGVGYVFVVDTSRYYSKNISFDLTREYLTAAIGGMNAQDRCAFVIVGENVITNPFSDRDSALTFLNQLVPSEYKKGDCHLYDGIVKACDMAEVNNNQAPDQKVIVVLSDGVDQGSPVTIEQVKTRVAELKGVPVVGGVLLYSKASGFTDEQLTEFYESRNAMINLFTITSGSFYDLLDGYNKDDKGLAAAAGRRLTSFGKNINSVIVNITDVSLAPTSDNVYRLRLLCNSDGRSVAGDGEVSMFASQIPTPTPSPTPTPAPTSKWPITAGTTGAESEIRYAQHKLKQLFYIDSDPNGQFDEVLQDALYDFYRQNGLKLVDGLSLEGYELLKSGKPVAYPTATPTPSPTPAPTKDPSIAIHPGDTGATVRNACYELEKLGYYVLSGNEESSTSFDDRMQLATDDFCRNNGLPTRDGMSVEALTLLMSGEGNPVPTPTPTPVDESIAIPFGETSSRVGTLQRRLEQLYYYSSADDGDDNNYMVFTNALQKSVDEFCRANGLDTVEGVSHDALNLLNSLNAVPKATATPAPTAAAFRLGDASPEINDYQIRLKQLNYYEDEFTPGVYDEATQAAQNQLCKVNDLAYEEGASVELQQRVLFGELKTNVEPDFATKVKKFILSDVDMLGRKLPMWALLLICTIVVLCVAVLVIVLVKGKKKRQPTDGYSGSDGVGFANIGAGFSSGMENLTTGEDRPTEGMGVSYGGEPPTTASNDWRVTFSIEFEGFSDDVTVVFQADMPQVIGRAERADIKLNQKDGAASRLHGEFVFRNGVLHYKDTSSHGSIVDGKPLHQNGCDVHNGSELIISKHRIRIHM